MQATTHRPGQGLPLDRLAAIRAAWGADTSAAAVWTPEVPAVGQCAVTALLVQDLLGGRLLRAMVGDESHYWNELPDGREIDLTRDQFEEFSPSSIEPRTREYVLSYPDTCERYRRLRTRFETLTRSS